MHRFLIVAALALSAACARAPVDSARLAPHEGGAADLHYEGTIAVEGHFRAPGEVRTQSASWRIRTDGHAAHRLDVASWEGDARGEASVDATWMTAGTLVARTGDAAATSLTGAEAEDA